MIIRYKFPALESAGLGPVWRMTLFLCSWLEAEMAESEETPAVLASAENPWVSWFIGRLTPMKSLWNQHKSPNWKASSEPNLHDFGFKM